MTDETPAPGVSRPEFEPSRRGYDRVEVDRFVAESLAKIEALERDRNTLAAQLGSLGVRRPSDLQAEFDAVSREVGRILQTAREAAEALRSRAAEDASRWRSEAGGEAEELKATALADAVAIRRDAWETGSEMLKQALRETERIRAEAAEDALVIRAEGEQEAHRLTSQGRKEIEDGARLSKLESERILSRARADAESTIEAARREAEAAQERAKALEQRRAEVMVELEEARAAIAQLETDLTARREALTLAPPELVEIGDSTSVRVVPAPSEEEEEWTGTDDSVRIVRPERLLPDEPVDALAMAEEVSRLREERLSPAPAEPELPTPVEPSPARSEPERPTPAASEHQPPAPVEAEPQLQPEPVSAPEVAEEAEPPTPSPAPVEAEHPTPAASEHQPPAPVEPERQPEPESPPEVAEEAPLLESQPEAAIDSLFASLRENSVQGTAAERNGPATAVAERVKDPEAEPKPFPLSPPVATGPDPFDIRDRMLLPITNRALRNAKRAIVDLQNLVLEELRTHGTDWNPDADEFMAALHPHLEPLMVESAAAGVGAAGQLAGTSVSEVGPVPQPDDKTVVTALVEATATALRRAADSFSGPRQTSAAVSRVFRAWRTDEAERRIRSLAFAAYHRGLLAGLEAAGVAQVKGVASGFPCGECPAAVASTWAPGSPTPEGTKLPPALPECACTIVPAG